MRSLHHLSIALLASLSLLTASYAQVPAAPAHILFQAKPHKTKEPMRFGPMSAGERAFAFEVASDGVDDGFNLYGYSFDLAANTVLATRNISIPWKRKMEQPWETCFLAGGRPAYLLRKWDDKANTFTLEAQALDAATLLPDGPPATIGTIHVKEPRYTIDPLGVEVYLSPDGSKVLFYYDRAQTEDTQVVMCWVTDDHLQPLWKGAYKLPSPKVIYNGKVLVDDGGIVFLKSQARPRGSEAPGFTWSRVHGEEQAVWDGTLPDGGHVEDMGMALDQGRLLLGGFVTGKGGTEWVRLAMDDGFKPTDVQRGAFRTPVEGRVLSPKLVIGEKGATYLYANVAMRDMIMVYVDGSGTAAWDKFVKGDAWYPSGFAMNGTLLVPLLAKEDMAERFQREGAVQSNGTKLHPALLSVDPAGKVQAYDLVPGAEGTRVPALIGVSGRPDYESVARAHRFVDFSYDKDHPGLVAVDLH